MILRLHSVRHKLLFMILIANFCVLVSASSLLLYHDLKEHRANTAAALTTLAGILGQGSAVALEFEDSIVAKENLALLSANPNIVMATIYNTSGERFAHYSIDDSNEFDITSAPVSEGFWFEKGRLNVVKRISSPHGEVGTVHLQEQFNVLVWLKEYLIIIFVVLLVSLALGGVLSMQLQRWISAPIRAISTLARQVMEQRNFHLRANSTTTDEIGQLGVAINGMLDSLEHEIAERSTAELEVRKLNSELEQRVIDRTAELQIANYQLASRTNEAETANRAKADFLSNMSHEIRTPMNAILGLAYLLDQCRLDANASDLVKKIRNAGRSLQSIINDILDFSKIEAGRLEIEHAPFHLDEVLDNLAGIMAANVGNKDIELVISPPPDLNCQFIGDALRLEQVLINLTGNAIKFTEQGSIVVDIKMVSRDDKNVVLKFYVRDTGVGIPPESQTQIFSAFSQADVSTTRRFGGTGLGLTICRHLVTGMGGEIGVTSEVGVGSEFWFTVPFEYSTNTEHEPLRTQVLEVLIVDNNELSSRNLSRIIKSFGWNPAKANSIEEAHQKIRSKLNRNKTFDVLLLDWKLPGSDGVDTASTILKVFKEKSTPIVLMISAFSRDELLRQSDPKIIDAVISKPVTSSALYNIVSEVMRPRGIDSTIGIPALPGSKGMRIEGVRVLVVDDSEINREVAMRILVAEGAQVELAEDGAVAVDWINRNYAAVDIILMDVQMPVMDGYEATRQLRLLPQSADLPIIALSAGVFKDQITAAREAGMNAFVAKPFNVDELVLTILEFTKNSREKEINPVKENVRPAVSIASKNSFPGIAVDQGLALWGELAEYCRFLLKFSSDYASTGTRFSEYIAAGDNSAVKALAHKLKGAAGNLALVDVAAAADKLEKSAGEEQIQALIQLKAELDIAFTSIQQCAQQISVSRHDSVDPISEAEVLPLLSELLRALDTDTPDHANYIIDKLAGTLPTEILFSLRASIDDFDFRKAEVTVHQLIADRV